MTAPDNAVATLDRASSSGMADKLRDPGGVTNQAPLDIKAVMRRLPHRIPFLMIDRVLRYGGDEVLAIKNVTFNESFFDGHFPGEPIMPGVMIAECMAQSAAFLGSGKPGGDSEPGALKARLTALDLKLKHPVVPGDQLKISARAVRRLGKVMRVTASVSVDDKVVACSEFTVVFM